MSTLEERALADSDDSDRFAATQRDMLTSFLNAVRAEVKVTAERDAARAALARIAALCRLADGMGVDVPASDLRAVLDPTEGATP